MFATLQSKNPAKSSLSSYQNVNFSYASDNDYVHVIEKRPDFLIAGAFSRWGQEEGYGNEYRTLDAEKDPMEMEGDNFFLLYGNTYDEFSPISPEARESLLNLDEVKNILW